MFRDERAHQSPRALARVTVHSVTLACNGVVRSVRSFRLVRRDHRPLRAFLLPVDPTVGFARALEVGAGPFDHRRKATGIATARIYEGGSGAGGGWLVFSRDRPGCGRRGCASVPRTVDWCF